LRSEHARKAGMHMSEADMLTQHAVLLFSIASWQGCMRPAALHLAGR
jgi:hypothetical protein